MSFKVGDRVSIILTEHSGDLKSLESVMSAVSYGIIHAPYAIEHLANYWTGPVGKVYQVRLFDNNNNILPGSPFRFHEQELSKCCQKNNLK